VTLVAAAVRNKGLSEGKEEEEKRRVVLDT
jgi:hypothetical protein